MMMMMHSGLKEEKLCNENMRDIVGVDGEKKFPKFCVKSLRQTTVLFP